VELKRQVSLGPLAVTTRTSSKQKANPVQAPAVHTAPPPQGADVGIMQSNASSVLATESPVVCSQSKSETTAATPEKIARIRKSSSMTQDLDLVFRGNMPLRDRAKFFIESQLCEMVVGFLILANALVMMFEHQYIGLQAGFVTEFPHVLINLPRSRGLVLMLHSKFWTYFFQVSLH